MFTVKHITLSGVETIHSAENVQFEPKSSKNCAPSCDSLLISLGGVGTELTGGTAFVMNEHGKTVSRYDLGASMVSLLTAWEPDGFDS